MRSCGFLSSPRLYAKVCLLQWEVWWYSRDPNIWTIRTPKGTQHYLIGTDHISGCTSLFTQRVQKIIDTVEIIITEMGEEFVSSQICSDGILDDSIFRYAQLKRKEFLGCETEYALNVLKYYEDPSFSKDPSSLKLPEGSHIVYMQQEEPAQNLWEAFRKSMQKAIGLLEERKKYLFTIPDEHCVLDDNPLILRHHVWLCHGTVLQHLAGERPVCLAVGDLHCIGTKGLVTTLREREYVITRISP